MEENRSAEGSLREIALLFLRLGLTAFRGPAAHIAMMQREIVAVVVQALWGLGRIAVKNKTLAAFCARAILARVAGANELLVVLVGGLLDGINVSVTRTHGGGHLEPRPYRIGRRMGRRADARERSPAPPLQGEFGLVRAGRRRSGKHHPVDAFKIHWRAAPAAIGMLLVSGDALAGPPYTTDDPEPVEYRHWELYLASQTFHDPDGWSGTAPHFELNYGVVPDVQLHIIAPLAYLATAVESVHYGYGDTELGVKFRFVQEGEWVPQIGTFPFFEVPTGSSRLGLGNGSAQVFVPIWFQKSFGPWTTYGGAGFWIDAGQPGKHWWYFGWLVQRKIVEGLAVGVEVFDFTPKATDGANDARFNAGAVIDITDTHHILLSAGRGFLGSNVFQGYFAYQVTLGPSGALLSNPRWKRR